MNTRKTYIIKVALAFTLSLIFILLIMKPATAFNTIGEELQEEPYRVESFDVDGPGTLDVKTSGGHITVESSSTNTVRVEMYVRKNENNLLRKDTNLSDWNIDISQSGNSVKAVAKHSGSGYNNESISFVIYTPREVSSNLNTSGGHIELQSLSGNQKLSTSGGHLELANLKGTIDARTSGGHIDITDIQGDLTARTRGGHIDVRNSEGKLKVKTSGGHIDLADVNGSVEAKTSGGSINAELIAINNSVDLRTSGGNIAIIIPKNVGLDLNLRGSYVSSNIDNFSGEVDSDELRGQLNGGGPSISARTSGGTVSLAFK